MQNYKTIISVIQSRTGVPKLTIKQTASKYHIGNGTVDLIMARYARCNYTLEDLKGMKEKDVEDLFYPPENIRKPNMPLPNFEEVHLKITDPKIPSSIFLEWTRYKKLNPEGYQLSQFTSYYNRWKKEKFGSDKISMAVERIPGEKLYIDWVGLTPALVKGSDDSTIKKAHFFVTSMGYSNLLFVKAYENERLENFIDGTVSSLNYMGALPTFLVPDNLKAAVTKHTKDELIINASYEDLERFYGVIVLPPPSRKPTGKATVERNVRFVETRIIPQLANNIYPSFEALNKKIEELVQEANNEKVNGALSKKETFEKFDLVNMKSLPQNNFSKVEYKCFSKVPNNYHLEYDNHYYSIPYSYYGTPAILKATFTDIKICDSNNKLITTHSRSYKPFPKYITKDEHMPKNHLYWKEVNTSGSDTYLRRARTIGINMEKLVNTVLNSFEYEQQAYNSLSGILHSCDGLPFLFCDEVAKKCLDAGISNYSYFKKMMNESLKRREKDNTSLPKHNNLRGKDFYK